MFCIFLMIKYGEDIYISPAMNKNFYALQDLQSERSTEKVSIIVPEIVLCELVEQKAASYINDVEKLDKLLSKFGESYSKPKTKREYECYVRNQFEDVIVNSGVVVVPICNEKYFNIIVERAIKKLPPFEGTSKESDKGFKDTVLFYSVVEYAEKHAGDYYFLSKDNVFSDTDKQKALRREFMNRSGQKILFYKNIQDIKDSITITEPKQHLEYLEYKYVEENYTKHNDRKSVPIEVHQKMPKFDGDEIIVKLVNDQMLRLINESVERIDSIDCTSYDDEPDMVYESSFEGEVCCNEKGILSICFLDYKYIGGAHGGHTLSATTYDLNRGKVVTLAELTGVDEKRLCSMIEDCVNQDIQHSEDGKYFDESYTVGDLSNIVFYVKDKKIYIAFNEYELGPYASGIMKLELCDL